MFFEIEETDLFVKIKTKDVIDISGRNSNNIKQFCSLLFSEHFVFDSSEKTIIIFSLSLEDAKKGDYDNLNFKLIQDLICSAFINSDDDGPAFIDVLYTSNTGDTSDIYISKKHDIVGILKKERLMGP